ncbi:AP-4 complex accessory subunit tepsin-like [Saccoglossus kowalevskii]|uniref:AP-4 complex accessory subunit tepsin-like n=1 Tax=Saccoglossus kowalevskii TaxID=10224 RepID=A0ABM0MZZ9_SACKO|nr:PREDICTED: AP-4 complex accessory subunit tepsin-like [Saccoglossus kowalevskii]
MATTSAAFSGLVDKVAFMNKLPSLHKATSDDETPTPGYMYQEINNISFESSGYCQCLLDFLVDRLQKRSYHVKFKVLRIMKYLVVNGNVEFSQGLRRSSKGIKEAMSFSGQSDPLHGQAPYLAVRKAAVELSEILFDTESKFAKQSVSSVKVDTGIGSVSSSGKMEGFGNTVNVPQKSILENLRDFAENIMDPYALMKSSPQERERNPKEYRPLVDDGSSATSAAPRYASRRTDEYKAIDATVSSVPGNPDVSRVQLGVSKSNYNPGKPGGGWDNGRDMNNSAVSNGSDPKSKDSTDLTEKLESVSVTDSSQEMRLVEDITAPGGVKPIPSRETMTQFTKRCATLNCDQIVEFLNNKLASESSQVQLKSLFFLEAMLKSDLVSSEYMLIVVKENLEHLCQASQGSTQTKSKKILLQLESMQKTSPTIDHQQQNNEILLTDLSNSQYENVESRTFSGDLLVSPENHCVSLDTATSVDKTQAQTSSSLFSGMNLPSARKVQTEVARKQTEVQKVTEPENSEVLLLDSLDTNSQINQNKIQESDIFTSLSTTDLQTGNILNQQSSDINDFSTCSTGDQPTAPMMSAFNDSSSVCITNEQPVANKMHDPLMSRTANMNDLLSSLGMSSAEKVDVKSQPSLVTTHNINTGSITGQTPQHTIAAFPQLSSAHLSGKSTIPLKFGQKQSNTFGFIASNDDKCNKPDSFDFVQDAMKATKK